MALKDTIFTVVPGQEFTVLQKVVSIENTVSAIEDDASEALATANAAEALVEGANTNANTALNAANSALSQVSTAITDSASALNSANQALATANALNASVVNAVATANNAASTANNAYDKSEDAETTANAASQSAINAVETATEALSAANTAYDTAVGKTKSYTFANDSALNSWLLQPGNIANLNNGDVFLLIALDQPDYWWDNVNQTKRVLETTKVDLTDYPTYQTTISYLPNNSNIDNLKTSGIYLLKKGYDYIISGNVVAQSESSILRVNVYPNEQVGQLIEGFFGPQFTQNESATIFKYRLFNGSTWLDWSDSLYLSAQEGIEVSRDVNAQYAYYNKIGLSTTYKNKISTLESNMSTAQSDISDLESTVEGIESLQSDISTAQNDIDTLQSDMSTAQNDIDTLQSDILSKENVSNKVTTLSESSTDSQYPSAKAVFDALGNAGGGLPVITMEQLNTLNTVNDVGTYLLESTQAKQAKNYLIVYIYKRSSDNLIGQCVMGWIGSDFQLTIVNPIIRKIRKWSGSSWSAWIEVKPLSSIDLSIQYNAYGHTDSDYAYGSYGTIGLNYYYSTIKALSSLRYKLITLNNFTLSTHTSSYFVPSADFTVTLPGYEYVGEYDKTEDMQLVVDCRTSVGQPTFNGTILWENAIPTLVTGKVYIFNFFKPIKHNDSLILGRWSVYS